MNKEKFYNAVRKFIENNAVEPRAGFKSNNLGIEVDGYLFSLEGRNRGTGYVTIRDAASFDTFACELPASLGGHFNEGKAAGALLALVEYRQSVIVRPASKKAATAQSLAGK